ncbi:histone-lysine N-methyltransferase SETMAR [Trichonephila clavipes]|nr:histone-lysine N-methyltransferase SETMAR [Trichonephila clavipes]
MGNADELTTEELQEILNEEHQETQRNVSLSEQKEDERGPMPTSAIKDLLKNCELQGIKNGSQLRENSVFLQFSIDKGENASKVAEIVNGIYGADTVIANYTGNFDFVDSVQLAIDKKWLELANRRGVVFNEDNARLHTSSVTHQNLWELCWKVLMHPPYSLSTYHLFLALENFLSDKKSGSREDYDYRLLDCYRQTVPILLRERHYGSTFNMETHCET